MPALLGYSIPNRGNDQVKKLQIHTIPQLSSLLLHQPHLHPKEKATPIINKNHASPVQKEELYESD